MRVFLTALVVCVGGALFMPHPAKAWWDAWGRWHPTVYAPPPYPVPYYAAPAYPRPYARWIPPHYDPWGRFIPGHWG